MKKKLLFFIFLLFLLTPGFSKLELTPKEKAFLAKNETIILGTDKDWEPYTIIDTNGEIAGYDASVLKLINELTGANFVLKRGKWSQMKAEVIENKIHGLSTGAYNSNRANYMNFSKPYLKLGKIIFTNVRKEKINKIEDLKDKVFAIDKNNLVAVEFVKGISGIKILETNSAKEVINAVTTGKADAMLGNAAMFYILNKMGNPFLRPSIFIEENPLTLVFAFRKDIPEAISIVNKALDEIGSQKLLELKKYWFQISSEKYEKKSNELVLNLEENFYLQNLKDIKMCIDPNWMPFEKLDDGIHIGLSADYYEYFQDRLKVSIDVVETKNWNESLEFAKQRKCDILSMAMQTEPRKKYMNFTSAYLSVPMVIATKNNVAFVDDLKLLNNEKIAVEENHAFADVLKNKYPNIKLVYVSSLKEGLEKVVDSEVFASVGSIADIAFATQKSFLGEVKIAGKFDERLNLSIAVRNDDLILFSIFEKLVNSIPANLKQEILNKHIAVKYEKGVDYTLVMQLTLVFIFLILVVTYWNRKLSIANAKLELAQESIKKKNEELKKLSITDKLTNVFNRAKLDSTIDKELRRFNRSGNEFGVILVDIDFFKNINDTYGHLVGDSVLVEFSSILSKTIRTTDIIGRWGGEEFLIICPDSKLDGVEKLANDLQKEIASYSFTGVGTQTGSFGVTESKEGDSLDSLILRVDEALYQAKNSGRNRVCKKA